MVLYFMLMLLLSVFFAPPNLPKGRNQACYLFSLLFIRPVSPLLWRGLGEAPHSALKLFTGLANAAFID